MHFLHLPYSQGLSHFRDRSGEGLGALLQTGPVSPAGPDFPQALLTSRRPVLPPDRASFVLGIAGSGCATQCCPPTWEGDIASNHLEHQFGAAAPRPGAPAA